MGSRERRKRSEGQSSSDLRARIGRWLLVSAMLLGGLGLGAVHTPVLVVCGLLAGAASALIWWDAEPFESRPAATTLLVVGVALVAWTAIQAVPLPRSLLAAIAPENADVWARTLTPLREAGPSWVTISLDPVATRLQVLRGITYLVVYVGALRVAQRQEGVAFLERALVAASIIVAAAAVVHSMVGAQKVFGVYEPKDMIAYDPHHIGPLLDTNHLAAFVNVGLLVAFACVIDRRESLPRPVAIVVVLLLGATTVWTTSRGGTGTMIVGALLVAGFTLHRRRARFSQAVGPIAVVLVALVGGAMLLLSAFDVTRGKFVQNDLVKVALTKNASQLLRFFPYVGTGRGAFESVYPKVRTGTEYWVFTHPENVVLQWSTEWGLPVAIAAFVAIAWALRPKTVLARSRPPAGAWAALIAVALHNLVDFNSEVPGVVMALALAAAVVTGGSGGIVRSRLSRWGERPRVVAAALGASLVVAAAVVAPHDADELYNEQRAVRDAGLDRSLGVEGFRSRVRAAMLRHPAEAYFPFVGAVRATVMRDDSVLPWASRALERSPVYGRVHLMLARSLYVRNPSQARLEYRIACAQDRALCAVEEAVRLTSSYDEALELVPDGLRGASVLARLGDALGDRLPSTVVRLDEALVARDPTALEPVRRSAVAALNDLRDGASWCSGDDRTLCFADGLAAARQLRSRLPELCEGHALAAELRVASGEVDAGLAELEGALDRVEDRSKCARRLVRLAQQTGNRGRLDAAIDRLLKVGCEQIDCVDNLLFAAAVETERGSIRRALVLTRKAWDRAPEREDLLVSIAKKAEAQGFHGEALEAYTKLAERHPESAVYPADVKRERDAVTRGVYERR